MRTKLIAGIALIGALTAACSAPAGDQPTPSYDAKTGRLKTLAVDTNKNGRTDSVSHMDGARILHIELDLDENGAVERWDFYGPGGVLERVGMSRLNDGVMDAVAFYDASGALIRMELSTNRDGRFERIEYYERGVLTRSTDDTNGDGSPDKWDTYDVVQADATTGAPDYTATSTAFDDSGSGRPERRFLYGPGGAIERVEVDTDGDGVFERVVSRPSQISRR